MAKVPLSIPVKTVQLKTLTDIYDEVVSARAKFPSRAGLLCALTEEVGEVAKALMDEPYENVYNEAKQVAAMAIRLMEECDPTLHGVRKARGAGPCCGWSANDLTATTGG